MKFIINFFKGMLIGVGAITPGVSGGSLAVIFGLYEKITDLIGNVFRELKTNFKRNFIFFLPIGLGGVIGVLAFSRAMKFLFANYNAQVRYMFIGLILGTLPLVFKQANKNGFRRIYIFPFAVSLVLTICVTALDTNSINSIHNENPGLLSLIAYGGILGFGTIIPGISASFILMYLGAYETILASISDINLQILIPVGIGFILSIVIFAKFINMLFSKVYGYTYYTILGFVIGSIIPIFPKFEYNVTFIFCLLLFAAGFALSYYLSKINKKEEKEETEESPEQNINEI